MTQPDRLHIGDFTIHWLAGGHCKLDGGTMFGAVPKILWEKRYPVHGGNTIPMRNDPLLVQTADHNILIDTGLGNKLTAKQQRIFTIGEPWNLPAQLTSLGLSREDIDIVLLTHCDWDHASGMVMYDEDGRLQLTFPRARHIIQRTEWQDVLHPGSRAKASYWPINTELVEKIGVIELVEGEVEIVPGVRVCHTGGHTRGHQIVEIHSRGQTALHLGDLYPTHAHSNPLWIMAYDNFPLEVIALKERYFADAARKGWWLTFYHDQLMRACTLTPDGSINQQLISGREESADRS